ncbi:ArsR/SmtB family transcription factor [Tuwongella immobilis]|uniref:HTH arsR-type domain-containing protein n=1 Tax=Tuwongella immobilis TaxID=692036 RepID=A0A6C2YK11_9BACT|nr:metalloregulator ArsR/SmtB family transcription factor [Tuwongella immobilis]VIP01920.1 family transcriptional regulator : Transcriptional regulator, ArsR family OS=Rhodopirellula europaea 6C GN=RE6C_02798 PE=4 SV=1: HTH_5 [Tuwongella immobilis]VTR99848.1 family transcriptional regulator : Transcriptional regulator, ArsR family OS=Rhodopirellula europaea 6C GN=RE6C_02798 PE=4 SV=1: HTH_5 [Tuwongella immobilis]
MSPRKCVNLESSESTPVPDRSQDDAELARLAWAIAHPARVRILRLLLAQEACVCGDLVSQLDLAQSTVSQHLKILKESGLVVGEIDGVKTCYGVNPAALRRLRVLIAEF